MSARIVAVTSLLIDLMESLDLQDEGLTLAEVAMFDILVMQMDDLRRIHAIALQEMQALAPAVLATEDPAA